VFYFILCSAAVALAAVAVWRSWIRPWGDLRKIVTEITSGRQPRTFLVDGNENARSIGIALEDLFLRQRELSHRAKTGESELRAILAAMEDGLALVDNEMRVQLINPALRYLLDLPDELSGTPLIELIHDVELVAAVKDTLRLGTASSVPLKLRNAAEEKREITATLLPLPNGTERTGGAVVLLRDVTKLQQLEQVRRDFVANVSHELRTPLSIFRGYLETLLEEPELSAEERERILRVLEKHAQRLSSLVHDLLSLARLESPEPQLNFSLVQLTDFLPRIVADWERRAAALQLRLALVLADDLPPLQADAARLEEILYNLLDNALKYSSAGQTVTLRAEREGEEQITLLVRDEGPGIAAADLPRIFERFYRADKARSRELGGTGLGLAIVKHTVQLHGGSVNAESQLGRGTTVRVTLPISRESAAPV
jgi:two-component system phosphate regulon sensor histidine kinase PhoR